LKTLKEVLEELAKVHEDKEGDEDFVPNYEDDSEQSATESPVKKTM